jgi:hypothetical protein
MTTNYQPLRPDDDEVVDNATLTDEIEEARKQLRAAIEKNGADYVYKAKTEGGESCLYLEYEKVDRDEEEGTYQYINPTGPSCIVGHVLVAKGVPNPQITRHEGEDAAVATEGVFGSVIVRKALKRAQAHQDGGHPWGEALEEFESYIREFTVKTDG